MTEKPYRPQEDIVQLMTQFEQEVKDAPELPDAATRLLRARLVFEEALEFVRACGCTVAVAGSDGEKSPVIDEISVVAAPEVAPGSPLSVSVPPTKATAVAPPLATALARADTSIVPAFVSTALPDAAATVWPMPPRRAAPA